MVVSCLLLILSFSFEAEAKKLLIDAGFHLLSENEEWDLKPGGRYFFTRNMSCLIAFAIGEKWVFYIWHLFVCCWKISRYTLLSYLYSCIWSFEHGSINLTYILDLQVVTLIMHRDVPLLCLLSTYLYVRFLHSSFTCIGLSLIFPEFISYIMM